MRCQRKNQFISWWTPFSALNAASQFILEHLPWFGRSCDLDSSYSATWDLICPLFALLSMHFGNSLRVGFLGTMQTRDKSDPIDEWRRLAISCVRLAAFLADWLYAPSQKKNSSPHVWSTYLGKRLFKNGGIGWLIIITLTWKSCSLQPFSQG